MTAAHSIPPEIPSTPNPEPEILPGYRPQPEISPLPDADVPGAPQSPEIQPDTAPTEIPLPDTQ